MLRRIPLSISRVPSVALAVVVAGPACGKNGPDAAPPPRADRPASTARAGDATAAPAGGGPSALRAQATRAYQAKDFATCARLFLDAAAASSSGTGSGDLHDAACCLARGGDLDGGIAALGRAIEGGFTDVDHLTSDADLAPLRAHPRWKALQAEAEAKDRASRAGQNEELARLFQEDQRDREGAPGTVDWSIVAPRDAARRKRLREIVAAGRLRVAADYFHAAMVLQHGEGLDYRQAHELALRAVELDPGHIKAKRLAASAMDRWLMSRGKPQLYGTQFVREGGVWKLHEVDPKVTDAERARWGVPPLAEARGMIEEMNRK